MHRLNVNLEQSGFSCLTWLVPPSPASPLLVPPCYVVLRERGDSACMCTSMSLWSLQLGWGRIPKSPITFPHPQVCCKWLDPPPLHGEPVWLDSWVDPRF